MIRQYESCIDGPALCIIRKDDFHWKFKKESLCPKAVNRFCLSSRLIAVQIDIKTLLILWILVIENWNVNFYILSSILRRIQHFNKKSSLSRLCSDLTEPNLFYFEWPLLKPPQITRLCHIVHLLNQKLRSRNQKKIDRWGWKWCTLTQLTSLHSFFMQKWIWLGISESDVTLRSHVHIKWKHCNWKLYLSFLILNVLETQELDWNHNLRKKNDEKVCFQ